jgi:hypothetical protein
MKREKFNYPGGMMTERIKRIDVPNKKTLRPLECIDYLEVAALWRTKSADGFDEADMAAMTRCFNVVALHGEARWFEAVQGNAAAACGIALRMPNEWVFSLDLAMTAVALCALKGNSAAALVVSTILRRQPGADRNTARLATSWLVQAFRGVLVRPVVRTDGATSSC